MGEQRVRIIGGTFRGRRLQAPRGGATRPTSDRVREALFSSIEARLGSALKHTVVLDAYCGSGAMGLEAISRGAAAAVLVDRNPAAVRAARENVESLDVSDRVTVMTGEVGCLANRGVLRGPFTLLILDPPYRIDRAEVRGLIETLRDSDQLADAALVVWEHPSGTQPEWPEGLLRVVEHRYGSTTVTMAEYERGAPS